MTEAKFTAGSAYYGFTVHTWNLPSGTTCPGALHCLAYADRATGKLRHGKEQRFRCYSATVERYPAVRANAWANFDTCKWLTPAQLAVMLSSLLPRKATHLRIHAGGDFFSQNYFDGWLLFCAQRPELKCWAFTKSIPYWQGRLDEVPANLTLTASLGGRHDALAEELGLRTARVVASIEEAAALGLPIDTDDALAMVPGPSFALLDKAAQRRRA